MHCASRGNFLLFAAVRTFSGTHFCYYCYKWRRNELLCLSPTVKYVIGFWNQAHYHLRSCYCSCYNARTLKFMLLALWHAFVHHYHLLTPLYFSNTYNQIWFYNVKGKGKNSLKGKRKQWIRDVPKAITAIRVKKELKRPRILTCFVKHSLVQAEPKCLGWWCVIVKVTVITDVIHHLVS